MVDTSRSAGNGVSETDRSSDGAASPMEKTTERNEAVDPNVQLQEPDDPGNAPPDAAASGQNGKPPIAAALIVAVSTLAIVGLSLWYLVQPQPLLVQGEADATRIDIAARVDGRIGERPVSRGEDIKAGQTLASISNPELQMKLQEAEAARAVAVADLKRIEVGTRAEVVAERKAAVAASEASLTLAQQTYDRTLQLTQGEHASVQNLDQATANLDIAKRSNEQAKLAYDEAVAGYTPEERGVAKAAVAKAEAAIATLKAQVAELTVTAPIAGQVYQIATEPGEYVSPGVPLLSLVDLSDIWVRFDLREDLVKGLKVGDHFQVKIPALGDSPVEVEVRTIATRGEYAGWRATRATGDFDLRTFEVRAYPVERIATLRPGMSAYADWADAR